MDVSVRASGPYTPGTGALPGTTMTGQLVSDQTGTPATSGAKRLLIVEDDPATRTLIARAFERDDTIEVFMATRGAAALDKIGSEDFSVVLLDIGLPDDSGLNVLTEIRAQAASANLPVIMLTGRSADSDVVTGLELGADDYITKPFSPDTLRARVRSVMRRAAATASAAGPAVPEPDVIEFGEGRLRIDIPGHKLWVNGELTKLPTKEWDLLVFFAKHPHVAHTYKHIANQVWNAEGFMSRGNVIEHVNRLRRNIGDTEVGWVTNHRGYGYSFEPPQ